MSLRVFTQLVSIAWIAAGISSALAQQGPQTPRDITNTQGTNRSGFGLAPASNQLNLCNIHYHANAEHKGPGFLLPASGGGSHGGGHGGAHGGAAGFKCNNSAHLKPAELTPAPGACKDLNPGDTIEVHWVYSSCPVKPGEGLGSCLSNECNSALRVEAQVFVVVNDRSALDFTKFDYAGTAGAGLHQPRALPSGTGTPVVFRGSTTGPNYSETKLSPLQVTWSVRPNCAKVDINSLHRWCQSNVFAENHGHGVRPLVTKLGLLDPIGAPSAQGSETNSGQSKRLVRAYCGGERMYRNRQNGRCEEK